MRVNRRAGSAWCTNQSICASSRRASSAWRRDGELLPLIPPTPFSYKGRRGSLGVLMAETGDGTQGLAKKSTPVSIPPVSFSHKGRRGSLGVLMAETGDGTQGLPKYPCGDVSPCGSHDFCRLSVRYHALVRHSMQGSDPRAVPAALLRPARHGRAAAPGRIGVGLHRPGERLPPISDVGIACGEIVGVAALPPNAPTTARTPSSESNRAKTGTNRSGNHSTKSAKCALVTGWIPKIIEISDKDSYRMLPKNIPHIVS